MEISEKSTNTEHEKVFIGRDAASGYHGIIAIHNTVRGPAVGGTRVWNYANEDDALTDVLRLSRGMTYKNALAELPLGGGKAVIIGDSKTLDRDAVFTAHGRFIEALGGKFLTAEDVGTSPSDMEIVRRETAHVAGLVSGAGDPSPYTARGVFRAIQAAAKFVWNREELAGVTVALQGCGNVGYNLAKHLHAAGTKLIVSDVDSQKTARLVEEFNAIVVKTEEITTVRAEVFAPCALGGVLNNQTIPPLSAQIVAGAANNQLLEDRHSEMLKERGIVYVPDYAANSGGIFSGCIELLGWKPEHVSQKVDEIYKTVLNILERARAEDISTSKAADRIAESHLAIDHTD
ncbi:MAG TPA: Glu/Leu/Phe/Val dehydrogenase dimerization domain-containing protein [Pyrinomonadaceae bacterium]|nr:Glu/Leu/Phe/Val dehydrogenase dimerization domain-containing protein [Pyrinomonadaceae bacterium]